MDKRKFYLALAALIGFTSLVFQTIGFQIVFLFLVNGYRAVGISTSAFLLGIAAGALVFSRTPQNKVFKVLAGLHALNMVYALTALRQHQWIPLLLTHAHQPYLLLVQSMTFWVFLFIPAFLIGGTFPLLNGLYLREIQHATRDTGVIYFFDTLGAAIGSLVTGFYFLPEFGIIGTLYIGVLSSLLFLLLISFQLTSVKIRGLISIVFLGSLGLFIYFLATAQTRELAKRFGEVLFRKNSDYGFVTVGRNGAFKTLFINYREMCAESEGKPVDFDVVATNVIARDTARNLSPHAKVLNIGLGCGLTAHRLETQENVSRLDIAEINPVVLEAAKTQFSKENGNVTESKKVRVFVENGASFLNRTSDRYDAIVIDIEEVSVIYSSPLYTLEYMKIIKNRLAKDGVFSLWSFYVNPDFVKILKNTAEKVFPEVRIQYFGDSINLYASNRKLNLTVPKLQNNKSENAVDQNTNAEINTLDHLMLEKYYDSNLNFQLPSDYQEPFVRHGQ